tara:strand:+ start:2567 stop:2698 length:132 start_codon:yes stop_codon:yes gene_type:complete
MGYNMRAKPAAFAAAEDARTNAARLVRSAIINAFLFITLIEKH